MESQFSMSTRLGANALNVPDVQQKLRNCQREFRVFLPCSQFYTPVFGFSDICR